MRIVITGTSGIGKTYLETILHKDFGFIQIPKYTNRPIRPGEIEGNGIYFVNKDILESSNEDYFFTLDYSGYTYSWKSFDLKENTNKNITIAITLKSLSSLLNKNLGFIPIILYIDQKNIELLEKRIKLQLGYKDLNDSQKFEADKIINDRLKLAMDESKNIEEYFKCITEENKGRAFKITDDNTIPNQVVPYIKSMF